MSAATVRRAIEISGLIEDEAGIRVLSITAFKRVQHAPRPASVRAGFQLEDNAATELTAIAALRRSAVEISSSIEDEGAGGKRSVAAFERVQDALRPASVGVRG